ncbi:hypothetical protein [Geobacillus phage GR1]|nr:hypothetical protein [Geobacillus phage GR1]
MITSFRYELPQIDKLLISKETEEMVLFEPFLLINPITKTDFPPSDEPYYTSLEMQLRHLLYKFDKKWITSERQVIYSSDECISTIHFIFDENNKVKQINAFQRSSNLLNLEDDVQFFNYFVKKYLPDSKVDINIFVSMPHVFKGKKKKIED